MSRRISCIPSCDAAFCQAANEALKGIDATVDAGQTEAILLGDLRSTHPRAEVGRQSELARVFNEDVWYADRDGRPVGWTRDDPPESGTVRHPSARRVYGGREAHQGVIGRFRRTS